MSPDSRKDSADGKKIFTQNENSCCTILSTLYSQTQMKTDLTVKCLRCDGTGRQDLAPEMLETLKVVIKLGEATARQVHEKLKAKTHFTAIHNRLEFLRRNGALVRTRKDKRFWYSAKV